MPICNGGRGATGEDGETCPNERAGISWNELTERARLRNVGGRFVRSPPVVAEGESPDELMTFQSTPRPNRNTDLRTSCKRVARAPSSRIYPRLSRSISSTSGTRPERRRSLHGELLLRVGSRNKFKAVQTARTMEHRTRPSHGCHYAYAGPMDVGASLRARRSRRTKRSVEGVRR